MVTKVLGVDLQGIAMTMLSLVGLYLILTNARGLNSLITSVGGSWNRSLVVLQGRSPSRVL